MKLRNISNGPRGAYLENGTLVMFERGQTEEGEFSNFDEDAFEVDGEDGLKSHTVKELKAIAEAEGIDLGDATTKADIIAAIELAREPK